ncbi:MAG TPA: sulfatase-like hydrolase/transferase [Anaerolineaceae bacterium]
MANRPNIILFNPDQWRGDVMGHFGNAAAVTPVLDSWVETDAVSFSNAYCQNPVCTPSRCSFMTGWYPHVHGHRTMFHMLRPHEPNLLKRLKDEGYYVFWAGKNDLTPAQDSQEPYCSELYVPEERPLPIWHIDQASKWRGSPEDDTYFSFYVGEVEKYPGTGFYYDSDWANVLGAIEFLERRPKDQPFCIYLPLTYPHPPYGVEDPWYSMIDRKKVPSRIPTPDWTLKPSILKGIAEKQNLQGWSEERWTELRATYYGMCARVDHQFGLLLTALRKHGLYDDTAVFFFADHGDFTGDYGLVEKTQNTFEDCLTRVPFLVKPQAGVGIKPRVSDALVELIDMPATVEVLANLKPTHNHFGKSLLPLIAGETEEWRDAVFCEGGRLHGETQCMELESKIEPPMDLYAPRLVWQRAEGPEHTKAVMIRTKNYKYVRRLYESDELYDLQMDPQEMHNRINDPMLAGVLAQMKERLLTFFLETGDVVPLDTDLRFRPR